MRKTTYIISALLSGYAITALANNPLPVIITVPDNSTYTIGTINNLHFTLANQTTAPLRPLANAKLDLAPADNTAIFTNDKSSSDSCYVFKGIPAKPATCNIGGQITFNAVAMSSDNTISTTPPTPVKKNYTLTLSELQIANYDQPSPATATLTSVFPLTAFANKPADTVVSHYPMPLGQPALLKLNFINSGTIPATQINISSPVIQDQSLSVFNPQLDATQNQTPSACMKVSSATPLAPGANCYVYIDLTVPYTLPADFKQASTIFAFDLTLPTTAGNATLKYSYVLSPADFNTTPPTSPLQFDHADITPYPMYPGESSEQQTITLWFKNTGSYAVKNFLPNQELKPAQGFTVTPASDDKDPAACTTLSHQATGIAPGQNCEVAVTLSKIPAKSDPDWPFDATITRITLFDLRYTFDNSPPGLHQSFTASEIDFNPAKVFTCTVRAKEDGAPLQRPPFDSSVYTLQGTVYPQIITCTNTSTQYSINGLILDSSHLKQANFNLSANTCSRNTLAPGASCQITGSFIPLAAGNYVGNTADPKGNRYQAYLQFTNPITALTIPLVEFNTMTLPTDPQAFKWYSLGTLESGAHDDADTPPAASAILALTPPSGAVSETLVTTTDNVYLFNGDIFNPTWTAISQGLDSQCSFSALAVNNNNLPINQNTNAVYLGTNNKSQDCHQSGVFILKSDPNQPLNTQINSLYWSLIGNATGSSKVNSLTLADNGELLYAGTDDIGVEMNGAPYGNGEWRPSLSGANNDLGPSYLGWTAWANSAGPASGKLLAGTAANNFGWYMDLPSICHEKNGDGSVYSLENGQNWSNHHLTGTVSIGNYCVGLKYPITYSPHSITTFGNIPVNNMASYIYHIVFAATNDSIHCTYDAYISDNSADPWRATNCDIYSSNPLSAHTFSNFNKNLYVATSTKIYKLNNVVNGFYQGTIRIGDGIQNNNMWQPDNTPGSPAGNITALASSPILTIPLPDGSQAQYEFLYAGDDHTNVYVLIARVT